MSPEQKLWRYIVEQALIDIFQEINNMKDTLETYGYLQEGGDRQYRVILYEMTTPWFKQICQDFAEIPHRKLIDRIEAYYKECGISADKFLPASEWCSKTRYKHRSEKREHKLAKYSLKKMRGVAWH